MSVKRRASVNPVAAFKKPCTSSTLFKRKFGNDSIVFFYAMKDERHRFLSNFAPVEGYFSVDGLHYPTSEHYFQSAKVAQLGFTKLAEEIRLMGTSDMGHVKRCGNASYVKKHVLDNLKEGKLVPGIPMDIYTAWKTLRRGQVSFIERYIDTLFQITYEGVGEMLLQKIMYKGLQGKFSNAEMKKKLLKTGTAALGERRGREGDKNCWTITGDGEPGVLGNLLMAIRSEIAC